MTQEEVYDSQINPLMSKIIEICKEHKIAALCTFSLDLTEGLMCTTALLQDEFEPPESLLNALSEIRPRSPLVAITVTTNH